jgi:hypothetical protein
VHATLDRFYSGLGQGTIRHHPNVKSVEGDCHAENRARRGNCCCRLQTAFAANPACEAQATEKKLSGAAKNSFVKKCERDAMDAATKSCDAQATEKKLSGAAKTSFTKKCVTDATGAAE